MKQLRLIICECIGLGWFCFIKSTLIILFIRVSSPTDVVDSMKELCLRVTPGNSELEEMSHNEKSIPSHNNISPAKLSK